MKALDTVIVPIHQEGRIFVLAFAAAAIGLFFLSDVLGMMGLILTGWCVYFFRDPERVIPERDGILISPTDGVVSAITSAPPPPELGMGDDPLVRISIFLNVFNVHVPRAPIAGTIERLVYVPGLFLNAADSRASEMNERQLILLEDKEGTQVAISLLAGLVARRIVCDLTEEATVARGDRMGIIRFGSRADIWVPSSMVVRAEVGQLMIAGETVIAEQQG